MKRLRLYMVGLIILCVVLLVSTLVLFFQSSDYKNALRLEEEANSALFSNAGRMCSVVSSTEASQLLESDVSVDAASYPAGFTAAVQDSNYLPLIDSCRYLGTKNNTRYVNIVGQRYTSVDEAVEDFNVQRTRLLDTENLDAKRYNADEAFYYGGAIYIRRGDKVLSYSVNKPEIPSTELQAFTEKEFDALYENALALL